MKSTDNHNIAENNYKRILAYLDEHEHLDKEQLKTFVQTLRQEHTQGSEEYEVQMQKVDLLQVENYKKLANQSLDNYSKTSRNLQTLANSNKIILEESLESGFIDVTNVTDQFILFQENLSNELKRANETISSLREEIKELEIKSNIDPLTKAYSKRAFENFLQSFQLNSFTTSLALLLIDIDDFRHINENFGNLAGDKVLIFLGKVLKSLYKEDFIVYRFGGEEFIVALLNKNAQDMQSIASKILEMVRNYKLIYKNDQIKLTLSIGATYFQENDAYDKLMQRLKDALKQAKENGKDNLVIEE